jgi:hypothetical protein
MPRPDRALVAGGVNLSHALARGARRGADDGAPGSTSKPWTVRSRLRAKNAKACFAPFLGPQPTGRPSQGASDSTSGKANPCPFDADRRQGISWRAAGGAREKRRMAPWDRWIRGRGCAAGVRHSGGGAGRRVRDGVGGRPSARPADRGAQGVRHTVPGRTGHGGADLEPHRLHHRPARLGRVRRRPGVGQLRAPLSLRLRRPGQSDHGGARGDDAAGRPRLLPRARHRDEADLGRGSRGQAGAVQRSAPRRPGLAGRHHVCGAPLRRRRPGEQPHPLLQRHHLHVHHPEGGLRPPRRGHLRPGLRRHRPRARPQRRHQLPPPTSTATASTTSRVPAP